MIDKEIICFIDIGTTKIASVIAECENNSFTIIGIGKSKSEGLKKGVIVDVAKTTTDENGLTWDEANNRHRENMLLNAEYNGQTINTVLNELVNNEMMNQKILICFKLDQLTFKMPNYFQNNYRFQLIYLCVQV